MQYDRRLAFKILSVATSAWEIVEYTGIISYRVKRPEVYTVKFWLDYLPADKTIRL